MATHTMPTTDQLAQLRALAAKQRTALTPMPGRGGKTPRPCACGCGAMTRGGTWFSGHDGRATGWATRVERGMPLEDVPANELQGCLIMLARRERELTADPLAGAPRPTVRREDPLAAMTRLG